MKILLKILILFAVFLSLSGTISIAAEVTLQWDASIDAPYLSKYSVYKTEVEGEYVLLSEDVNTSHLAGEVEADILTFVVSVPDGTYKCWFVVTCTDTRGLESDKSNEVKYDTMPPGAPSNLRGSPSSCKADIDLDGDVDGTDLGISLAIFSTEFGRTDCTRQSKNEDLRLKKSNILSR